MIYITKGKKQAVFFTNEITKYFSEKGYLIEQGGPPDLIIKKNSLTIPVEVKCRTKNIKNDNMFTVAFTINQLLLLKKEKGILLLVDDGHEFYESRAV